MLFLCASPVSGCAENFRLFWGLLSGGRFEAWRSAWKTGYGGEKGAGGDQAPIRTGKTAYIPHGPVGM